MTHYKNPEHKASETVTFRLTIEERRLLDYLSEIEQKSLTDLIRHLLFQEAVSKGITEVPPPPPKKKRGRPKMKPPKESIPQAPVFEAEDFEDNPKPNHGEMTFFDLVEKFRNHFSGRAEGTKKELKETIQFLVESSKGEPLLSFDMPLAELTSEKLREVRDTMRTMDIRMAKKNLHLTYLRMMLHWAVKQTNIALSINPALDLKSFSISEIPKSWPGRSW